MRFLRRFAAWLTLLALLAGLGAAWAEPGVLRLPSELTVVETEAFAGLPMERAVLPEGIETLGDRAFAGSGLRFINLPASVNSIQGDPFADCESLEQIVARPGTYAYDWLEEHGYVAAGKVLAHKLTASVTCTQTAARVGDTAVWEADAADGLGACSYAFTLYRDDSVVSSVESGANRRFAVPMDQPGIYRLKVVVTDDYGSAAALSDALSVTALRVRLERSASAAWTGESITWTAVAEGASGPVRYAFDLNGVPVEGTDSTFSAALSQPGNYVVGVTATDRYGSDSARCDAVRVVEPLNLLGVDVEKCRLLSSTIEKSKPLPERHVWTVNAEGGTGADTYAYRFQLRDAADGRVIHTQEWTASSRYEFAFVMDGSFQLQAWVKDAAGERTLTLDAFTVVRSAEVTGVVRIYLNLDSNGNPIVGGNGHYELQLGSDARTVQPGMAEDMLRVQFDGHELDSAVMSYGYYDPPKDSNVKPGKVTLYDASYMPYVDRNVEMYTFTFTTGSAQVFDLLFSKLPSFSQTTGGTPAYRNADGEAYGYDYKVTAGPFTTYQVTTNNCFTALAVWCKWLGYGDLSDIVAQSATYKDYAAYSLYQRMGSTWTKQNLDDYDLSH